MSDQQRAASPFLPRVGRLRGRPLSHEWDELRRRASSRAASFGSPPGPPLAQLARLRSPGWGGKRPGAAGRCRSSAGAREALQGNGEVGAGAPAPCRSALLARSGRLPLPWVNDHLDFMVAFIPGLFSVSFSPRCPYTHLSHLAHVPLFLRPCPFPPPGTDASSAQGFRLLPRGSARAAPGPAAGSPREGTPRPCHALLAASLPSASRPFPFFSCSLTDERWPQLLGWQEPKMQESA